MQIFLTLNYDERQFKGLRIFILKMTQQKIHIIKSPDKIKECFVSHIKNSIIENNSLEKDFALENLHDTFCGDIDLLQKGSDQSTIFHKAIYATFDKSNYFQTEFWENYKKLCFDILEKLKSETSYFGEWAIQRYPTIRIQFPNNLSVFEFHRDSNYSHPIGEINCFYAINECIDSSALHVEKNLGFEDYLPLNLNSGEYAILNTSIYKHGDVLNKTGKTRFSMDFRFIPTFILTNDKRSLTKGIILNTDSYFISENSMKSI